MIGWKNISILTLKNNGNQILVTVLKKTFLSWWQILPMVSQWEIYEKESD